LENADIRELLERAIHDKEKGMGSYRAEATDEALDFLADMAGGETRARRSMRSSLVFSQRNGVEMG
jgi:putative ATPase